MKKLDFIMGMPIQIEIVGATKSSVFDKVFKYFVKVDNEYSPFKKDSQVGKFNRREKISRETTEILGECERTKIETNGYFDIWKKDGRIDPSGLVKGWAIKNAARIIEDCGYENYVVDAGGDMQLGGLNSDKKKWAIGIRNPFDLKEIAKVVYLSNCGLATSGNYERGQHIWDPVNKNYNLNEVASISVIGKDIYDADRYATAAFAMGRKGIGFIDGLPGFEGYMIDSDGIATMTRNFEKYSNS